MERVRSSVSPFWAAAFEAVEPAANSNTLNKEKIISYLLNIEHGAASSEARLYVLNECKKNKIFFTQIEEGAIEGHNAASLARYNEALNSFRAFQTDGKWPDEIPQLFIEFPNLINDLGRAFQYTASGNEGMVLFMKWETGLLDETDDLRFRLLFYAARIARRIGSSQNAQAISLFERAFAFAPDTEQLDACIWYIFDLSLTGSISIMFERLERYVPQWHNGSSYNNILERYLHRLVSAREWRRVVRTYDIIKDSGAAVAKSGYAWVIARAMEEGYLNAEDRRLAARALGAGSASSADAAAFMRIAYNESGVFIMPAIYYRMKSAESLGLPFLEFAENNASEDRKESPSMALEFLLGFFSNDAARLSNPYIRLLEKELSPGELQTLAQSLEKAGIYTQSMRVVSLYVNREGYVRTRRDLELMYPRPYLELIEEQAKEFDITPHLFFALVRTESAFQSAVVSRAGAVGLAQLMPNTAREQAERIRRGGGPDFFGSDNNVDSTNPVVNLYIGAFYLNFLRGRLDDMYLALMAYNGGQNRVRRWRASNNLPLDLFLETVPIYETRDYGKRVTAISVIYEQLYYSD